jgi:hypothetical protein
MLKMIGQLLTILLITAIAIAGVYALVQNTAATSAFTPERSKGVRPTFDGVERQESAFLERNEHSGEREASLGRGLAEMVGILLKFSVITAVVLFIRNLFVNRSPAGLHKAS